MKRLALLLLLGSAWACGPRAGSSATAVPPAEVLEQLPGNYTMKMVVDDDTRYSTAVVKQLAGNQYQVARITVYGPVYYVFTLGPAATLQSEQLGQGSVTYQSHIQKLTLHFEKGTSVCELSR